MNNSQWYEVVKLLGQLWSKWELTDAEIEVWKNKLCRYDVRAVEAAIKNFYAGESNTRNRPKLSQIIKLAGSRNVRYRPPSAKKYPPEGEYITEKRKMEILKKCAAEGNIFARRRLRLYNENSG